MSYVSKIEVDASSPCKRYFKILNFFKIASGDNSVFELGYSEVIEEMANYVFEANKKYISSINKEKKAAGLDDIEDYYIKKIHEAANLGDNSEVDRLTEEMNKMIVDAKSTNKDTHNDIDFFTNEVVKVRSFLFSEEEAKSIFSQRFMDVLKRNLSIDDFSSVDFKIEVELEEPKDGAETKGHVSHGKFPAHLNINNNLFYLGRIFIRINKFRSNFNSILDILTHELKHLMQKAGGLTLGTLEETNIPFGMPSSNKVYKKETRRFEDEKGKMTHESFKNSTISKDVVDRILSRERERNDELRMLYQQSSGKDSGKRVMKITAPIVIKLDDFNLAIGDSGSLAVNIKKDPDNPFLQNDISEVKKFFSAPSSKDRELNPGMDMSPHDIIPSEFFTNLSGKILTFRSKIYELISEAKNIANKEPDKLKRKILLLEKIFKDYGTPEVKKYLSNLPYLKHLNETFYDESEKSTVGIRSIDTHISSAISQYAYDMMKSRMLNFDRFKKRLNIITDEKIRSQVWDQFSKQADKLMSKELSNLLKAARSDSKEIINILEGGDLNERSFFRYFEASESRNEENKPS